MAVDSKEDLIKSLIAGRENLYILQGMLRKERFNAEQKLLLTNKAKQHLDSILHELTGDEFYRNERGVNYDVERNSG
jgi:hypothetical protein